MYSLDEMQNLKNEANEDAASDDLFVQEDFDAIDTWILTHTDAKGVQYFVEGWLMNTLTWFLLGCGATYLIMTNPEMASSVGDMLVDVGNGLSDKSFK